MKRFLTIIALVVFAFSTNCYSQNYTQSTTVFYTYGSNSNSYEIGWYWLDNLGWYFFNGVVFCPEVDCNHYFYDGEIYVAPFGYNPRQVIVVSHFYKHHTYRKSNTHHVYHYVQHNPHQSTHFQSHSKPQCERPNPNVSKPHSSNIYHSDNHYHTSQKPMSSSHSSMTHHSQQHSGSVHHSSQHDTHHNQSHHSSRSTPETRR